ncbi:hypothetical protein [Crocinitomix catalasitica]|uniref:hypothetical protein n=1 Tax=Crocinitomix catalasitica TaxID=184607 RepID=UPI000484E1A2|nr:hypothetical protein [Crocinitomix catalasitica]
MKKLLLGLFFVSAFTVNAQQKNAVKFTISPGLVLSNNLGFNYERKLGDRISLNTRFNFSAKNKVPFNGLAKLFVGDLLEDEGVNSDFLNTKISSYGFNFQFKYFPGAGALHGFYLTPYFGFQNGKMDDFTFDFPDSNDPSIEHEGRVGAKFNYFGAGIGLGNQFVFGNGFTMDILWVGLGWGMNKLTINGTDPSGDVNYEEIHNDVQQFRQDNAVAIEDLYAKVNSSYTSNSIDIIVKHPFPYVKLLNFSLGFAF